MLVVPSVALVIVGVPHVFRASSNVQVSTITACDEANVDDCDGGLDMYRLVTGGTISAGNSVRILSDGDETYPQMYSAMRQARRSLTVQVYSVGQGMIADSIAAILASRSRSEVAVYFLFDAFGGHGISRAVLDSLRVAGVHVASYKPIRWYSLDRANNRTHVRSVVIDGVTGFTGGFGFDDRWLGNGIAAAQWREANARVVGPVVHELQAAFVATWAEATGVILADTELLAEYATADRARDTGAVHAGVIMSMPTGRTTAAARLLAFMIARAHSRLYITNAYFVPPPDFVRLLTAAARQGVDVRVLTNGPRTDVRSTWLASHTRYAELLRAGVRIYEYEPTTLHAKTIVMDGEWSTISTINFDNRSLAYNSEVALQIHDHVVAGVMDSIFMRDLANSHEILPTTFRSRSMWLRVQEFAAGLIADLL
jgi:cardiolipin synthase